MPLVTESLRRPLSFTLWCRYIDRYIASTYIAVRRARRSPQFVSCSALHTKEYVSPASCVQIDSTATVLHCYDLAFVAGSVLIYSGKNIKHDEELQDATNLRVCMT
jgi:hypothetical protein